MTVVDVFMFNDEFDMLDCRAYELDGLVDVHIAIEGNLTMSGQPKPFRLAKGEYRYMDDSRLQVVHADLSDIATVTGSTHGAPGMYMDYWKRDWLQRSAATDALADISDDAIIIYGDVDEIPRRAAVEEFDGPPQRMIQELLIYSVRWSGGKWGGSVIGKKSALATYPEVRRARESYPMLHDGGWHLTWFGGQEAVVAKAKMFAHGELAEDIDKLRQQYHDRRWPGEGRRLEPFFGPWPIFVEDGLSPGVWG